MTPEEIRNRLFGMQDLKYRDFQAKLMPGVEIENIIGVRTPELRKFAKEIWKSGEYTVFLAEVPHKYYDEQNLHGFIVCEIKDYDEVVARIDEWLPSVDNWATCDLMRPKVFAKHKDRLIEDIWRWMASDEPYTIRFGIEMLMTFFLDDDFRAEYLEPVAKIRHEHYYVKMMVAWFFATALAKQWEASLPYIEEQKMDEWTHNKAIQKAIESYRITDEQKAHLRTFKIKKDK
ncbi:MAG: DNA alkylation repair protein [Firmicutes bacterium]|nr:DNA alkylation repair protein [Bacillota bacterium]